METKNHVGNRRIMKELLWRGRESRLSTSSSSSSHELYLVIWKRY